MSEFVDFIKAYGKDIGLPELCLNENNACSLNFDSTIDVDIVYKKDEDQCIFASNVGTIPSDNREIFFKELLKANAFGMATAGASLGIDEENNTVVLSYVFITQFVTYELFKIVLNNFVNLVEEWMQKVKDLDSVQDLFNANLNTFPQDTHFISA